ncbi:hypothetical protein [Serratia microhaemolytica]|uniref:hypothetical protein n=1 Tax=Serratia microhaemolytica TaxID=2675110 RepID=UPI000FDE9AF9|nr:hypothetical protein [Serratia microhaemolytica]
MKKIVAVATFSCLLLAGCQSANESGKAPATTQTSASAASKPTGGMLSAPSSEAMASIGSDGVMQSCVRELNALRQINAKRYQQRSEELEQIVSEAKLYISVRDKVSDSIHQIMDPAYQFRISKVCSRIRSDLTTSLVERVSGA